MLWFYAEELLLDLHVHTNCSDGTFSPEEVVELATKKSILALAITDHDTTIGAVRAIEAAKGADIEVIPGVEISTASRSGILHVLGYYINPKDMDLSTRLEWLRNARNNRITMIVEKLVQLGISIKEEDVYEHAGKGAPGRPHVANALVKKSIVDSRQEAFDKYLVKHAPAYVEKMKLKPEESITLIRKSGGVAAVAHPYTLGYDNYQALASMIGELKDMGLMGIEAYYPRHTPEQTSMYLKLAKELDLIVTGGTDFHGANKPDVELGVIPGFSPLPLTILDALKLHRTSHDQI